MATKRNATSPASKDSKKHKDEECIICCKPATDNIMECVWCEARLHAGCAKLSEEQCILIGNASSNIVFFCTPCLQALPMTFQSYEGFSLVDSRISGVEKSISELQTSALQSLNAELKSLQTITSNLATKIKDLCTQNTTLQDQIQTVSSELTAPDLSANSIADELADRKRREANVIVYNLPELPDKSADGAKFTDLCNTVFGIKVGIVKSLRLGKKQDNKSRPFLITMESLQHKEMITANSYFLRRHELYKSVFISPDMTKYQRGKRKELVEELKRRRIKEPNLVIRDGVIITRATRSGQVVNQTDRNVTTPASNTMTNS